MNSFNKIISVTVATIIFSMFLFSCDFTPRRQKRILDAQQYIAEQKYQKAVYEYEKVLTSNPPPKIKVKMYYQLGELYSTYLSDHKKALFYYEKIKNEISIPLWMVRAEEKIGELNFTYLKNYKEATISYKRLASFIPKLKAVDFFQERLGLSYMKDSKLDDAIEVFLAIRNSPKNEFFIRSSYNIGLVYFEKNEWKKAAYFFNEYIKNETRKDNIVQAKFMMANAYENDEKLKKAYDIYYSILGEYPNSDVIKKRLNSIYERKIAIKR